MLLDSGRAPTDSGDRRAHRAGFYGSFRGSFSAPQLERSGGTGEDVAFLQGARIEDAGARVVYGTETVATGGPIFFAYGKAHTHLLGGSSATYAVGFSGEVTLADGSTVQSRGGGDIVVISRSSPPYQPTTYSIRHLGGPGEDRAVRYHEGYLVGCFEQSAQFGETTLTASAGKDAFVFSLATGSVTQLGGPGDECATDVLAARTLAGPRYVVGWFDQSLVLPSTTIPTSGARDGFLVRLGEDGVPQGGYAFGGTGDDELTAIGEGLTVAGTFSGTATFGTHTVTAQGPSDGLVMRIPQ